MIYNHINSHNMHAKACMGPQMVYPDPIRHILSILPPPDHGRHGVTQHHSGEKRRPTKPFYPPRTTITRRKWPLKAQKQPSGTLFTAHDHGAAHFAACDVFSTIRSRYRGMFVTNQRVGYIPPFWPRRGNFGHIRRHSGVGNGTSRSSLRIKKIFTVAFRELVRYRV